MFELGQAGRGAARLADLFLLAPTLARRLEGDPVERVSLLRDEMANLAWGVEHVVPGASGEPVERALEAARLAVHQQLPTLSPDVQRIYRLTSPVPVNWIPFEPVATAAPTDPAYDLAFERRVLLRTVLLNADGEGSRGERRGRRGGTADAHGGGAPTGRLRPSRRCGSPRRRFRGRAPSSPGRSSTPAGSTATRTCGSAVPSARVVAKDRAACATTPPTSPPDLPHRSVSRIGGLWAGGSWATRLADDLSPPQHVHAVLKRAVKPLTFEGPSSAMPRQHLSIDAVEPIRRVLRVTGVSHSARCDQENTGLVTASGENSVALDSAEGLEPPTPALQADSGSQHSLRRRQA
jgi:hypothetical protein